MHIKRTLAEMIAQPLTGAEISAYRAHARRLYSLELRFVVTRALLWAGVIVASYVTLLLVGYEHSWKYVFASVLMFFTGIVPVLFAAGGYSLKKLPMELMVGDKSYLRGTTDEPFLEATINENALAASEKAQMFYQNIQKQGRPAVVFEKQLLQDLCAV